MKAAFGTGLGLLGILVLIWHLTLTGDLQESQVVSLGECRPCEDIVLAPEIVVGDPKDPVLLNWYSGIATGAQLYAASRAAGYGGVPLFGLDGRAAGVVGRRGHGPGEFIAPLVFPGPRDRLWAVDMPNQRVTVIDSTGSIDSMFRLNGAIWDAAVIDSSRVVVSGMFQRGVIGRITSRPSRVHIVDRGGEVDRSFPSYVYEFDAIPRVTVDRAGRIWVAPSNEYRLESWDSNDGTRGSTFVRNVEWFHSWQTRRDSPRSTLMDIVADDEGRLWVFADVPDASGPPPELPDGMRATLDHNNWLIDTVIEVVDVRSGKVVAHRRFPNIVRPVEGARGLLLYLPVQDDSGYVRMQVSRARVSNS